MSGRRSLVAAALAATVLVGTALSGGASATTSGPPTSPPPTTEPTPTETSTEPDPDPTITLAPPTTPPTTSPPTTPPTTSPPTTTPPTTSAPPSTTPPSATPTPTPTETGGSATELIDREAAAAFAAATEQLRQATADLLVAQGLLVGGDDQLTFALAQQRRAETAAVLAAKRRAALTDELAAAQVLYGQAEASIAGHARQVYQDGAVGAFGSVLAARGPADFANRASNLDAVTASSEHTVELVLALPDRIAWLEEQLDLASTDRRAARGEAEQVADARVKLARAISGAQRDVTALEEEVELAIEAARAAIPEDQALAAMRGAQSDRLGSEMLEKARALEDADDVVPGTGVFARPATGVVTSPYGWRVHPILGYRKLHTGVDFDGSDDIVYAADDGTVIMTVYNSAYGNVTVVDHGQSGGKFLATFYAHQSGFLVEPGDVVTKGQPIGAIGSTGLSTGPHLHFEVRLDGSPVDPSAFLDY